MNDKEKITARVEELKAYVGKTFVRNDGKGTPIKITGYGGVGVHQEFTNGVPTAVHSHLFTTDSLWTPPATKFLEEHHEIENPKQTETKEIL